MLERLRRLIPTREQIAQNRWLRWLGPSLLHPRLWHFSRRGVAVGVSLGIFFGLLIPIAQIPLAAGAAVVLRANVAVAVSSTLVTNPFTFAPIYVLAHRLGAHLLGTREDKAAQTALEQASQAADDNEVSRTKLRHRVMDVGKPLIVGLGLIAVLAGLLTYVTIMVAWRIRTAWAWRRRRRKQVNDEDG